MTKVYVMVLFQLTISYLPDKLTEQLYILQYFVSYEKHTT